ARLRAGAIRKPAAEDVHQNRQFLPTRFGRRPHVQIEAIFAHPVAAEPVVGPWRGDLHAARTELAGVAHARPVLHGLWFFPAQIADRRLRKRDSLKAADSGVRLGSRLDEAIGDLDAVGGEPLSGPSCADADRNDKDGAIHCLHTYLTTTYFGRTFHSGSRVSAQTRPNC